MKKQYIQRIYGEIWRGSTIVEVQEKLAEAAKAVESGEWKDMIVSIDSDDFDAPYIVIKGDKLETDEEFSRRMTTYRRLQQKAAVAREKSKAAKEEKELKEYERLKKKYKDL